MGNILKYKDYYTVVRYSREDKVLFGKIEGIRDLVTFESDDVNVIEDEFQSAVDDYLMMCKEKGKIPDRSPRGRYSYRLTPRAYI